ncbi:MAG: hypothetical protein HYZ75_00360 [Elusimicrobia bacterium]|nr:hypothetical protein [Elusimicrobiota bacterium]
MSEFLKRNKKKGALALLLLFFQRGKGLGPLLALLLILSFMFISPSGLFLSGGFFDSIGRRLGLGGGSEGEGDPGQLVRFSEAIGGKGARGFGMIGGLFGLGKGGEAQYGKSTIDMVRPGKELETKAQYADGVGKTATVDGVLRPDDAAKLEGGVAVSESDMQNGLLAEAFAGEIQGGPGLEGLDSLREKLGGNPLSARASNPRSDLMNTVLGGRGLNPRGGKDGSIKWDKGKGIRAGASGGLGRGKGGSNSVMYKLAESKAYSVAAAPPPGHCNPGGCPGEFASNTAGAVFDGGSIKGGILDSAAFGSSGVDIPGQGQIDSLIAEASKAEQDALKCEKAEADYGSQERQHMDEIGRLSDELNAMDCGGGGCGSSKYKACMRVGDQMKVECRQYNDVAAKKAAACPLMEGKFSPMDCNQ